MTLKEWIQKQRKAGYLWTLERVAREIGIAPGNLSRAVHGHTDPRLSIVKGVHDLTNGEVGLDDWPARINPL